MTDGKHCPACSRDIGIWSIFTAGLPSLIRCPHCRARLTYRGIFWLIPIFLVLSVAVVVGALYASAWIPNLRPDDQMLAAVGLMLGAWAVVELAVALFLRANRELIWRDRGAVAPTSPDAEPSAAPGTADK